MHVTLMMRHVRDIPISAEDYLRKKMYKANRPQKDDKVSKLRLLCMSETIYLTNMRMDGEDISQKTMQQLKHTDSDQPGDMKQSSNSQN